MVMHAATTFWRCAPRASLTCHHHGFWQGHGPAGPFWGGPADEMDDPFGGGSFGVRRPLRFLAHRLGLDDRQVAELARILDELKTERAQAEVDRRRTLAAFADAVGTATFDDAKASDAGQRRVDSAQRLRDAVVTALKGIHAVLDPEQRE